MRTPQIVSGPNAQHMFHERGLLALDAASPTATLGCAIGQWIYLDSGVYKVCESGRANASHVVTGIFLADGVTRKTNGYLTNAEIDAGGYLVQAMRIGGLEFYIEEDGDGGNLADTDAGSYVDIVVANPSAQELAVSEKLPFQHAEANITLDSSSVNTTQTGLLVELIGPAPIVNQKPTAADGPRIWLAKVATAAAQASQ